MDELNNIEQLKGELKFIHFEFFSLKLIWNLPFVDDFDEETRKLITQILDEITKDLKISTNYRESINVFRFDKVNYKYSFEMFKRDSVEMILNKSYENKEIEEKLINYIKSSEFSLLQSNNEIDLSNWKSELTKPNLWQRIKRVFK